MTKEARAGVKTYRGFTYRADPVLTFVDSPPAGWENWAYFVTPSERTHITEDIIKKMIDRALANTPVWRGRVKPGTH